MLNLFNGAYPLSHAQQENLFEHFSKFWGQSGKKKRKNQSRSIAFYNYDITIFIAMMYISISLGPGTTR